MRIPFAKRFCAAASCMLLAGAGLAGERPVPVLSRHSSGALIAGRERALPPADRHLRILPFDGVSRRSLLRRSPGGRRALSAAAPDTVRVLLLRVSFQTDRLNSLSSIATGGGFDFAPSGTSIVDPTPHDKGYFDSHLKGLANFVRFQSCGRIEVVWRILPDGETESYELSDIADYGPGTVRSWRVEDLVRFFRDGVMKADEALAGQGYPVRFGDYDALILAHAGANLQSDIDGDTPNDIPSFFAALGDDDRFTVDGGATVIEDGSVVPETAIQDGFIGGIAGVLAHEFGHQLGLADLYNVETSAPCVGVFDLMDTGSYLGAYLTDAFGKRVYVEGFIPGGFGAWSRTYLGWTEVDTVATFDNGIALGPAVACPSRVVRIEASSDEYFLVENRVAERDNLLTSFVPDENGVFIGTGNCLNCGGGIPADPQWQLVNAYDVLLPIEAEELSPQAGPGLLVWRVADRLVRERWEEDVVNTLEPFGITLLEANGVVDLGDPSSPFGWGWWDDAYFLENKAILSDSTLPPAWSTWGVPTGARIELVGPRDTVMTFGAGVRSVQEARRLPTDAVARHGILPLGPDPSHGALVVDSMGTGWIAGEAEPVFSFDHAMMTPLAYGWIDQAHTPVVAAGELRGVIHLLRENSWSEPDGWPYVMGSSLATHPAIVQSTGGGFVAAADRAGRLHVIGADGAAVEGFPRTLTGEILGNLVVSSDTTARGLFCLAADDADPRRAWLFRFDVPSFAFTSGYPVRVNLGEDSFEGSYALAGGDISPMEEGEEIWIVSLSTGRCTLVGRRGSIAARCSEKGIQTPPALMDVNGDGYLDLVYSDGAAIHAVSSSGANVTGWPRDLGGAYLVPWPVRCSAPLTEARDGAGGSIVLAGSEDGLLYAFRGDGALVGGAPRKISDSFREAVDLIQGDWIVYRDGARLKWRTAPARGLGPIRWRSAYGNLMRTAWGIAPAASSGAADAWLALADRLKIYPNPSPGDRVAFHFAAPSAGEARLQIMTLAGELVHDERKSVAGGEDEFVVSMADKASGVYLCRLVVTSRGRSAEALRKFAIVR